MQLFIQLWSSWQDFNFNWQHIVRSLGNSWADGIPDLQSVQVLAETVKAFLSIPVSIILCITAKFFSITRHIVLYTVFNSYLFVLQYKFIHRHTHVCTQYIQAQTCSAIVGNGFGWVLTLPLITYTSINIPVHSSINKQVSKVISQKAALPTCHPSLLRMDLSNQDLI